MADEPAVLSRVRQEGLTPVRQESAGSARSGNVLPSLEIAVEHDAYIAGQENVVRLLISNPYENIVTLESIKTPESSSLKELNRSSGSSQTSENNIWTKALDFLKGASFSPISGVVFAVPQVRREINVKASPESLVKFTNFDDTNVAINIDASVGAKVIFNGDDPRLTPQQSKSAFDGATILPRSTIVVPVTVKTRRWLLFTPQRFGLQVEIRFTSGNIARSQVVNTQIDIKPPLIAMIFGAVSGGFLGALVAALNQADKTFGAVILHCSTAVLMSCIAAVSLSRRGNTQAFVTVEDFFGAFFVGALIGYGGVAYFEKAIIPAGHEHSP